MGDLQQQRKLEVLVIDDDEAIRLLLSDAISEVGDNVTTAVDGEEGKEKYFSKHNSDKSYDVVLTDLNMPNISGTEVIRIVKQTSPQTPVYCMTGKEASEEYQSLAIQLGELKPDGILQKPFNLEKIYQILNEVRSRNFS